MGHHVPLYGAPPAQSPRLVLMAAGVPIGSKSRTAFVAPRTRAPNPKEDHRPDGHMATRQCVATALDQRLHGSCPFNGPGGPRRHFVKSLGEMVLLMLKEF